MRVGGSQDEDNMWGRLFEGFQEGVGALPGDHVHLVDYVDLIAQNVGGVVDPLLEVVHIVDAAVASLVDLYDIEGVALIDREAGVAFIAGLAADRALAVDRLGQDTGCAGLAATARAAEQVGMRDPAAFNGIEEGLYYMFLAGYFAECLWTPFTIEDL